MTREDIILFLIDSFMARGGSNKDLFSLITQLETLTHNELTEIYNRKEGKKE